MAFPVPDLPQQRAIIDDGALAMREIESGNRVTYAELDRWCGQAAALLRDLRVGKGDRVAILCRNRIECYVLLFACARISAILVPLNWRMPVAELKKLVVDCGTEWLAFGREDQENANQLGIESSCLINLDASAPGFRERCETMLPLEGITRNSDEIWYLLYTSGTTGSPKAVIQTFGMTLANYINISQGMGLRGGDTTLCFLPMFHSAGINLVALPVLMLGGTVLVTPGFDPTETLKLLDKGEIDAFFGVPAAYQALALEPEFNTKDLTKTRTWGCGGAALPDNLYHQFEERGAVVLNGMGMTETGPTVFLMDKPNAGRKVGSVGKPQVLAMVRLVGPDGRDVKTGEHGELWFSGPGITPGYYNNPEATAEAFADNNWLRSGDLACRDDEGYFTIVGRIKDMFISGGENVYPAEVEQQLAEHPDILEAAVIGMPDDTWGEVGCAFLLPCPGCVAPPPEVLAGWLRTRIAGYKIPKSWHIVEDFPRTAAGKIQKHLLERPE